MTLRELINQATDEHMDLSEPSVELDYQLEIYLRGQKDLYTKADIFNIKVSNNNKIIRLEIGR